MPETVRVGMVGAGFAAGLHLAAYRGLAPASVELAAITSQTPPKAEALARRYGIERVYPDLASLLADPGIDVVDLCVPNRLHEAFTVEAAQAGKHVICEKPLTGYYGGPGAADPVGATPRRVMWEAAVASAERMLAAARQHHVRLMYAENWLYAPAVEKARRLVRASGGTILEIRAQECHSGSHAGYARSWREAGGGALVRLGSHPLGTAIHLKWMEGLERDGRPIEVQSVVAEVGDLTRIESFRREREQWLATGWQDVENWATVVLTFTDGSHATIFASDAVLGGLEDTLEVYLSNGRIKCDMAHSTLMQAYAPAAHVFGDEYIAEKLETKAGWSYPSVDEEWLLGYRQELRDFVEALAHGREPVSSPELGAEVVRVMYAAYVAAEEGRRVVLRRPT